MEINELNNIGEEIKNLQEELKGLELQVDIKKAQLEDYKTQVIDVLQNNNLNSFKTSCGLNLIVTNKFYVAQPNGEENEKAFKEWLVANDLDNLRKVNSQTLNKLYRDLQEQASEQGEIVVIPGLELPTTRTTLSIRKV